MLVLNWELLVGDSLPLSVGVLADEGIDELLALLLGLLLCPIVSYLTRWW